MKKEEIERMLLFICFFGVGLATMSVTILYDDWRTYYQNKRALEVVERNVKRLKELNDDYDALLSRLRENPGGELKRIAPATLGAKPADEKAVYPRATADELAAAKATLSKKMEEKTEPAALPRWVERLGDGWRRVGVFLAGSFLIIISFMFFGPAKKPGEI